MSRLARSPLLLLCSLAVVPAAARAGDPSPATAPAAPAAAPAAPSPATAPVWMPLAPGSRWSYVYQRERSRETPGKDPVVETLRGVREDEIVRSQAGLELRSLVRARGGDAPDNIERRNLLVEPTGGGFRVLSELAPGALATGPEQIRFDPPLAPLRTDVAPGARWPIGVVQRGGERTALEGEILGVQDARTPAGLFEKCLVVRTTGVITGSVDLSGERIEIKSGKSELTDWYAPGVGRVLSKQERQETLELPDGKLVVLRDRVEFALGDADDGSAPDDAAEPVFDDPEEHPAAPETPDPAVP